MPAKPPPDSGEPQATIACQSPRPGFWEAVLWTMVYGGVMQFVVGGSVVAVAVVAMTIKSGSDTAFSSSFRYPNFGAPKGYDDYHLLTRILAWTAISIIGAILASCLIVLTTNKQWRLRLRLFRPGLLQLILAILGLPALIYLDEAAYGAAVDAGLPRLDFKIQICCCYSHRPTFNYEHQVFEIPELRREFIILVAGTLTAVAEELFFRGFLRRGLISRYGTIGGVLLTSLFFGVVHLDPRHIVGTFVFGLGLHYVYLTTRSLWLAILPHFLNNSLGVLVLIMLPITATGSSIDVPQRYMYAPALVMVLTVGWALYRYRTRLFPIKGGHAAELGADSPIPRVPRSQNGMVVVHQIPSWFSLVSVSLALLIFIVTFYLMN